MDDNNHTDINLNNIYLIFNHLDILCIIPQFFYQEDCRIAGFYDNCNRWMIKIYVLNLSIIIHSILSEMLFKLLKLLDSSNYSSPTIFISFFLNYWEIIWKECFFRHPMIWKIWFYLYAIIYSFILAWVIGALLWYVLIFYE